MDFPESVKLESKRKANYHCVICRRTNFLHVHHIIPQEEDGPATLENAAPLCVECHDLHGNDARKRKWIREARDFWYEECERRAKHPDITAALAHLDSLQTELVEVKAGQARQDSVLGEVKAILHEHFRIAAQAVDSAATVPALIKASSAMTVGLSGVVVATSARMEGKLDVTGPSQSSNTKD